MNSEPENLPGLYSPWGGGVRGDTVSGRRSADSYFVPQILHHDCEKLQRKPRDTFTSLHSLRNYEPGDRSDAYTCGKLAHAQHYLPFQMYVARNNTLRLEENQGEVFTGYPP